MPSLRDFSLPATSLHIGKFIRLCRWASIPLASLLIVCGAGAQTKAVTSTTLSLTSTAGPVTTAAAGTVITLTASVRTGSAAITTGQIGFCDAPAASCTDVHRLATGQLTSAGTAVFKFRPGIGSHTYTAVFGGTGSDAASISGTSPLTVTGTTITLASSSSIAESGAWGNYTLSGTVTEIGGTNPLTGSISFLDTSNGNGVLDARAVGGNVPGLAWPNSLPLATDTPSRAVAVGDFNGDGIQDLAAIAGGPLSPLVIWLGNPDGSFTAAPAPAILAYTFGPIIVADLNADGKPDLAILNGDSNTVSVLLGNGDGTFTVSTTTSSVGANPNELITSDFNGDGILDLAVTAQSSNALTILLGNGDGSFMPSSAGPIAASQSPYTIVAGDFNRDGNADLAAADLYDDTISIWLGKGDGTFGPASSIHSGSNGAPLAAADFNGDGRLDLVVGVAATASIPDSITIVAGNGDGTFTSAAAGQPVDSRAITSFQIGDFNGDGVPDVAMVDAAAERIVVLVGGPGGGSFSPLSFSPVLDFPHQLLFSAGDFNGDGRADFAIGDSGSDNVTIELTRPTQTSAVTGNVSLPSAGLHQVAASYAGDNHYLPSTSAPTPLWGVPPATTITLSLTSGGAPVTSVASRSLVTLMAAVHVGTTPVTAGQVRFCDSPPAPCADAHLLATAQLTSSGTATFRFVPGPGQHVYQAVFLEEGAGMSSASNPATLTVGPGSSPVYTDSTSIALSGQPGNYSLTATVIGVGGSAPVTGTISFLDTSFGNSSLVTAALGANKPGVGWLISQTPAIADSVVAEVSGDFNGDGMPDLALLYDTGSYGEGPFSITILLGHRDGSFATGSTTQATGVQTSPAMIAGDFNGDGRPDVAIFSGGFTAASTVTVLLGNGDGTLAAPQTSLDYDQPSLGGDYIPGGLVAADFNGDGKIDIATAGADVNFGGISILLGNGDGTFASTGANVDVVQGYGLVATGDFNGDHIPDLVATQYFGLGGATVYLGKGDGTFQIVGSTLAIPSFPTAIVVADFNSDGAVDLAFGNNNSTDIYLGKGDGTFNPAQNSPFNGAGLSLVAGDFNRDGKLDLAGIDNYNDQIDLLLGAGDGTFISSITTPNISQIFLGPFAIVPADFNGDGVPDLAMATRNSTMASILLNQPTQTAAATVTGIAPVGAGVHNVEANYPGNGTYGPSISSTVALQAGLKSLVFTPPAGTYTSPQTIAISEPIPGATLYYSASGTVNSHGFVPYSGPIGLTTGGAEEIDAYAEETGYSSVPITIAKYTLNLAGTTNASIALAPSASTVTDQQPVSIAVSVRGAASQPTPTGSVQLTISNFTARQNLSSGTAALTIPPDVLRIGANQITVSYSGDAIYGMANSTTTIKVVPVFVSAPAPVSVAPNGSATAKFVISSSSTYSGTLQIACALTSSPAGAKSLPTCSLNPAQVVLAAKASANVVLSIQTSAASTTTLLEGAPTGAHQRAPWLGGGGALFAVVALFGLRHRRRVWSGLLAMGIVCVAAGLLGCGGSSSSPAPNPTGQTTPATTTGSYIFTVTVTDQANATVTTSANVIVTVQ